VDNGLEQALRRWLAPAGLVVVCALVLLGASPASAHAILERSTPAADAVLRAPPTSVDLVFDEGISLLPDSVRVFGPDGSEVDDRHVVHAGGVAASAAVGLRGSLAKGTYLVSYRVISADSHPVSGAYTFSIGHRSTPPAAASPSRSTTVDLALGAARWLTYAGSALGLGGLAFLAWFWPAGWSSRRVRSLVNAGTGSLLVGTFLALALKGPYDGGLGLAHVSDGDLFREVLGTTYGRALDARLLLLAVLILLLTYRERVSRRVLAGAAGLLLLAVGVTFALCGHAAAGGHRPLAIASDTAHVAAMSVWLGGLVVLASVVLRADASPEVAVPVIGRFSTVATASVCVLVATGTYQALREVRSWDVLFETHYGHVLLVKLWFVVVALGAALGSRAWVWQTTHPVVAVNAATTATPVAAGAGTPTLRSLRTSVGVESLALVGVLVVSALLVSSNPARPPVVSSAVSTTVTAGPDTVRVSAVPAGPQRVSLRLQVLDAQGHRVEPREVDASFSLSAHDVGPLPVTLTKDGPGLRTGHASLPLSGHWQLAITVRTSAIDEATAYTDVPVG
jgi:copper transport protein